MLFPAQVPEDRSAPSEPQTAAPPLSARITRYWWLILFCTLAGSCAGFAFHAHISPIDRTHVNPPDRVVPSPVQQAARDRLIQADAQLKRQLDALNAQSRDATHLPAPPAVSARLQTLQRAILDTQVEERSLILAGDSVARDAARHREDLLRLSFNSQLKSFPAPQRKAAQSSLLRQEIASATQASKALDQQIAQSAVPSATQPEAIRSTQAAAIPAPASPFTPRALAKTLAGALLGAMFGLLFATLSGRKPRLSVLSVEAAQPRPLLHYGIIPDLSGVVADGPYDPIQTLAYSILLEDWGKQIRRYAITSVLPGSGKTTVAANIGVALSRIKLRVVIVDANLQNPKLHRYFDLPNEFGLRNILRGQADLERDPIAQLVQPTPYPGLSILSAGRAAGRPETLLKSPLLQQSLDRLGRDFDLILIDLPAVSPEALIVAAQCQGAVLVLSPGDSGEATRIATESLAARDIHLSGSAINHLPMAS